MGSRWIVFGSVWVFWIEFWFAEAYDPIDPFGNVTIKWDFMEMLDTEYQAVVTISNNQLYRHIEAPGWKLGWTWPSDQDCILSMQGAEATKQGNCTRFKRKPLPHCCEINPVIVDLLPGAPYNIQTANCCRGGVVASMTQDPSKSVSSFQMEVASTANFSDPSTKFPTNFSIGVPGYTCSDIDVVPPSQFSSDHSRRKTQALMTWEVICTYSQFRESNSPGCCVSLSTFYNDTIVPCPPCSCGCLEAKSPQKCYREGEQDALLQMPHGDEVDPVPPVVLCTKHMCPIRVHWHVKLSYKEYWRVKMTITNLHLLKNYSDWNLVVEHPNLRSLVQIFSFNYHPLIVYPRTNDTGMFWGIQYYNTMLLNYGESGNVQTEMLLHKDPGDFTFKGGWAFPRRILFNGHECVMPTAEMYPSLPNSGIAEFTLLRHLWLVVSPLCLLTCLLLL